MIVEIRMLVSVEFIFGMEFHPQKAHVQTHILMSGFIQ